MEVMAKAKYIRISPRKARLVADQVRGKTAEKAIELLNFSTKKAAGLVKKTVDSAVANAEHNEGADIDGLFIKKIFVDEGPTARRFRPRARGRVNYIDKPTCHITVVVSDRLGD